MLSLKDISKHFFARERLTKALEGISLDVTDGEFLTMVGPSGCGKSTFSTSYRASCRRAKERWSLMAGV